MKAQFVDRNGLLKPIGMFFILLGMFLLILLLYVCCCQENLFAQSGGTFIDDHYTYSFSEPEATIVYVRYKKPERIVGTIEPSVDINQLSSQLMMDNADNFGASIAYTGEEEDPIDRKSERKGKKGIMKIKMKDAIKDEEIRVIKD